MEQNTILARQEPLELNLPSSITIIGCGGTGFWVGLISALSGVKNITIFDGDYLEIHNLNRLPYSKSYVGRNKAELLGALIKQLREDVNILCFPNNWDSDIHEIHSQVIFDCTDSVLIQEKIKEKCRENQQLVYIRSGCSENHITVDDITEEDQWSDKSASGYDIVPSWSGSAMLSAVLAVSKVLLKVDNNLSINMQNMFEKCDIMNCLDMDTDYGKNLIIQQEGKLQLERLREVLNIRIGDLLHHLMSTGIKINSASLMKMMDRTNLSLVSEILNVLCSPITNFLNELTDNNNKIEDMLNIIMYRNKGE